MDKKKALCILYAFAVPVAVYFMLPRLSGGIATPAIEMVIILIFSGVLPAAIMAALTSEIEVHRESAFTDPLSGLYNRRGGENAFLLQLNTLYRERRRGSNRTKEIDVCVIMIDIDRFKSINDRFGHGQGDTIIREICQVIRQVFPRSTDICIRPGGDELSVILLDTTLETAQSKAVTICHDWSTNHINNYLSNKMRERVTLSIGIAANTFSYYQHNWPNEIRAITERADEALYKSKGLGRNRTTTFTDLSRQDSRAKIETTVNVYC